MALSRFELRMRHLGNFCFASSEVETKRSQVVTFGQRLGTVRRRKKRSRTVGTMLTSDPAKYIVLHAMIPEKRRAVRWNGFMWSEVREDER